MQFNFLPSKSTLSPPHSPFLPSPPPPPQWRPPLFHYKPCCYLTLSSTLRLPPLLRICLASASASASAAAVTSSSDDADNYGSFEVPPPMQQQLSSSPQVTTSRSNFWAAVSLIVGTAVGPGMLGLPSATLSSGPLPSTLAILLCWLYVVSSVLLVAELTFAAMEDSAADEVSFTTLASRALGPTAGAVVAAIYASLSFSLLVACVSGIGSLTLQRLPALNPVLAHALFPCFVGVVIGFFPFKAIDIANRSLCALMLFSIAALVVIGFSIGRSSLWSSLFFASWRPNAILPAVPVTVLTLGFHVITPFVCKIVRDSIHDARKAIIFGGAVPLVMVLSWNFVILGLAGSGKMAFNDPIKLLLSVNPAALPAVQGFAFAALATSLIGYTVSFPKQLTDTTTLITNLFDKNHVQQPKEEEISSFSGENKKRLVSDGVNHEAADTSGSFVTWIVLLVPVFIASFFPTAFAKALDFSGVYANCFLFGVLPPAMAWIHRTRIGSRSPASRRHLLPGGTFALGILFGIAVLLGIWH